jgi:hypothetical protein
MSSSAVVHHYHVIPAKAGIQAAPVKVTKSVWIPAFAGMTDKASES